MHDIPAAAAVLRSLLSDGSIDLIRFVDQGTDAEWFTLSVGRRIFPAETLESALAKAIHQHAKKLCGNRSCPSRPHLSPMADFYFDAKRNEFSSYCKRCVYARKSAAGRPSVSGS